MTRASLRQQSHRRLQHGLVSDAHRLHVAQRAERPAGIVVRPRIVDVVILRVQQHVGHARIRLVHADDVRAGRKLLVLDGDLFVGGVHLNAHQPEQVDHVGRFHRPRLIRRDDVGRRAFIPALATERLLLR